MTILTGDCRETLATVKTGSVHCCVTSPPYWNLRDYQVDGQIGLEKTPQEFIAELVSVFSEVHRVLRDDGTLWINMGETFENKNIVGIPWRLAFALQDAGWYLRQDLIWHKPSPMPSSVKDRCTTAHEYLFLLTKRLNYYYDWYAISEECSENTHSRGHGQNPKAQINSLSQNGVKQNQSFAAATNGQVNRRNKRSVWTVSSGGGYSKAHFATYPPKLIEPCILAGSPDKCCAECGKGYVRKVDKERVPSRPGNKTKVGRASSHEDSPFNGHSGSIVGNRDPQRHVTEYTEYVDRGFFKACDCDTDQTKKSVILDPFGGSGTTAMVAQENGRGWIMCELNPDYVEFIQDRTKQPLLDF